ncbi:hypothetical protein D9758_003559 [Tetrapyrgos nigripes]|uniref:Aldehyde dehydrogenase domain-containing protein n=1 Tax=Tetrapyrgos nigripes TaxID=182062 RepID=A0A8H5GV66_9AGAR|nr:hypothetical protein D9758_003559 [Tetrapyrgos nigripes]
MSSNPEVITINLDTPLYKGSISLNTGLFINGEFVRPQESQDAGKIDIINPSTSKPITSVHLGSSLDVDIAVDAARKAFKSTWGLHVPGSVRGQKLQRLAELIEENLEEIAALEALNCDESYDFDEHLANSSFILPFFTCFVLNPDRSLILGKPFAQAKQEITIGCIATLKYYAGWADKIHGKTIETSETKMAYTRREPYGVVGAIIPWNGPLAMFAWKVGPAVAAGNAIVLKPSELTPLTALRVASLINEAGFPPGVINIVNGYGPTVGSSLSSHPLITKIAFTGSTVTGRKIQEAAAKSNLKVVTLELGGKSPNIIFDDADLEQAIKWAGVGIFTNMGQACCAGSRIFVQEGIYDAFIQGFTAVAQHLQANTGDPFSSPNTLHGPQASEVQYKRILSYISSGIFDGAHVQTGGEKHSEEKGYFIKPTIFTNVTPSMKIAQEEIFGPVAAVIKFKTEEEVIEMANNTTYGLACAVFTENISRGIRVAHAIDAGTAWINTYNTLATNVPFGGYKQSGIGRELGEYALENYTQVKAVHINIGMKL